MMEAIVPVINEQGERVHSLSHVTTALREV